MKEDSMQRMMADLAVDRKRNPAAFANDRWEREGEDDDDDDGEDVDVTGDDPDLIDRSKLGDFHTYNELRISSQAKNAGREKENIST